MKVYVDLHALSGCFDLISARTLFHDPALLKPHPHLINQAVDELGAAPVRCVLIGDSVTDVYSAQKAGVRSIGYANKPGKRETLAAAGADAVITDMARLVLQE